MYYIGYIVLIMLRDTKSVDIEQEEEEEEEERNREREREKVIESVAHYSNACICSFACHHFVRFFTFLFFYSTTNYLQMT